jgi:tRNA threonylcarbamoyladenosine biosynthesis protein TsaE
LSDKLELLYPTPAPGQIGNMSVVVTVALPDLTATETLAERLASQARAGDCILLEGPLGAGKTALARAFLRAAAGDPVMEVPSPSFTLVQIYDTKIGPVFHYDLWRLDGPDSLAELDWEDALDGIVLVEWPDRLGPLRPAEALSITLRLGDGEAREATLIGWDGRMGGLGLSSSADVFRSPADERAEADGRDIPGHDRPTRSAHDETAEPGHKGVPTVGQDVETALAPPDTGNAPA